MMKAFLIILMASNFCFAQSVKIGNIEIDSKSAQSYFLDCYNHPDTLTREYVDGCGADMEREVKQYNEWLSYVSIKHIVVEIIHPATIDTIPNFMSGRGGSYNCPFGSIKHEIPYFSPINHTNVKGYNGHEKDFRIVPVAKWVERVEIGFAVPRKPSEIDYIKWLKRTQITVTN